MSIQRVLTEIQHERLCQAGLGFDEEHDSHNRPNDWIAKICVHLGRAGNDSCELEDSARFRRQMLRVAALAVAAIESVDRDKQLFAGPDPSIRGRQW